MHFLVCFLLMMSTAYGEVGKVLKVMGENEAYLIRNQEKILLSPELALELQDEIFTLGSYSVIHLYPGTQLSLAKDTRIKLSAHQIAEENNLEKATSIIDFIKGIVRLQVTKDTNQKIDQKIKADGVAFGVRGTEFEVSLEESNDVDLDVFEGEVEVTSPFVHTFVPEIVKANEGFRFDKKKRSFSRRRFAPKFRNHPGFSDARKLRKEWRERRQSRIGSKKKAKFQIKDIKKARAKNRTSRRKGTKD